MRHDEDVGTMVFWNGKPFQTEYPLSGMMRWKLMAHEVDILKYNKTITNGYSSQFPTTFFVADRAAFCKGDGLHDLHCVSSFVYGDLSVTLLSSFR